MKNQERDMSEIFMSPVLEYDSLLHPIRQYSQFAVRFYSFHEALFLEVL